MWQKRNNFRQNRYKRPLIKTKKYCHFCKHSVAVDFLNLETLNRYITVFGKIQPRKRTGACAKHQREINKAIKKARLFALLPAAR